MIDGTTKLGRGIATSAVLVAGACGIAMNYHFSRSIGVTEFEKNILGVFGVSIDVIKLMALSAASYAWAKGHRLKGSTMFVVWVMAVAYGLLAAFGFAAVTRDSGMKQRIEEARPIKDAITKERAAGRRFAELEKTIKSAHESKMWESTVGCLDATARLSREFCANYKATKMEFDVLVDTPKIMWDTEAAEQMKLAVNADPQIAILSDITGLNTMSLMFALVIFLAVVIEAVTSLGVYGFSRTIKKPERQTTREDTQSRGRPRLVVGG